MKTLIVSAFPGCGKTYLSNMQLSVGGGSKFIDKDNGHIATAEDAEKYIQEIIALVGKYEIIFISQYPEVIKMLNLMGYKCVVVAPNNLPCISNKSRTLIKQQWFGRFLLRGNRSEWIEILKQNYEQWTDIEHLSSMNPEKIILLNENEYLTDILVDLQLIRETI